MNEEEHEYSSSPQVLSGKDVECQSEDFCQADDKLVYLGRLGNGSRVIHNENKQTYIIINIVKRQVQNQMLKDEINSAIELMYQIETPYILRVLNHFEDQSNLYFIIENYEGETLKNKIDKRFDIAFKILLKFFKEICICVNYLNKNCNKYNINILPENILISQCAKITDYNLQIGNSIADNVNLRPTKIIGNGQIKQYFSQYSSPEEVYAFINQAKPIFTPKTDSWNLGVLLFEMIAGFNPLRGIFNADINTPEDLVNSILNANFNFNIIQNPLCKTIITALLKPNPNDRPSIDQILELNEFRDIPVDEIEFDPNEGIINGTGEEEENNEEEGEEEEEENNGEEGENNENQEQEEPNEEGEEGTQQIESNTENQNIISEEALNQKVEHLDKILSNLDVDENKIEDDDEPSEESSKSLKSFEIKEDENIEEIRKKFKELSLKYDKQRERNIRIFKQNKLLRKELEDPEEETYLNDIVEIVDNYKTSQTDFEEVVDRLLQMNEENENSLKEITKKYVEENFEIFFDLLKKKKIQEENKEFFKNPDEAEKTIRKQELATENKILDDRIKVNEEIISVLNVELSQVMDILYQLETRKSKLEQQFADVKLFIETKGGNDIKTKFNQEFP